MKITVDFYFPEQIYDSLSNNELFKNVVMPEGVKMKIVNRISSEKITCDSIEIAFCNCFGFDPKQLQVKTRKKEIKEPRQILHYLAKKHTNLSFAKIGKRFGNKDHATVLNSYNLISNLLKTDREFKFKYKSFIDSFKQYEKA